MAKIDTINMSGNNWVGWNYKSRADEIVDLVIDEVNDMLKKNKVKINYQYNDDNNEGWDYFLELTKENNDCRLWLGYVRNRFCCNTYRWTDSIFYN